MTIFLLISAIQTNFYAHKIGEKFQQLDEIFFCWEIVGGQFYSLFLPGEGKTQVRALNKRENSNVWKKLRSRHFPLDVQRSTNCEQLIKNRMDAGECSLNIQKFQGILCRNGQILEDKGIIAHPGYGYRYAGRWIKLEINEIAFWV